MTDKTETPTGGTCGADKTSRVAALFYAYRVMIYSVTSFVVLYVCARIGFWAVGWPWVFEGTLYRFLLWPFVGAGWLWFWIWFVDLRPRGFSLTLRHPRDDDNDVAADVDNDHHDGTA
ncbi:MAG: hypothetical protein KTV16_16160 [Acidimicrobiia bacterium]|nr:hypothetical protein [Acidimicrobiia bacterium]